MGELWKCPVCKTMWEYREMHKRWVCLGQLMLEDPWTLVCYKCKQHHGERWTYKGYGPITTNASADTPEPTGYQVGDTSELIVPGDPRFTEGGIKYDTEKTRYDLVHWPFIEEVAEVLTIGAAKYSDDNWKAVLEGPNGRGRYVAAAFRHFVAWLQGEKVDPETGKSHLAHMVCCLMFLAWGDRIERKANKTKEMQ